ncbi:hypothetical protein A3L11_08835 [Thermococcus siculi]|uniref:Uncharacterized protein n=1 Tax=Thermococcus siculi TaxID=72803 RepID=A0A2Z2MRM5_9EURY|nr:hypothetical protein [Thermococcus siculi]ASJ09327.1 hypothetical protein A3L11_08835 [Thermococcus siculi]
MTSLSVEPPEYYPVIEKLFAGGIKNALETLGVELVSIKAGVVAEEREIKLAFVFEMHRPETFLPGELDSIISSVLERLAEDANRKFGRLYNVRFHIVGFRTVEASSQMGTRGEEANLVINCPDDLRRTLERMGKGLMIYLKDRKVEFSTLVLTMPQDGRPKLTVTLLLPEERPTYEKERLAEELEYKAASYLRTLNADYISVKARVIDPGDKTVGMIMSRLDEIEKEAKDIAERDDIRDIMSALGKNAPES